jgi:hypothetical protein
MDDDELIAAMAGGDDAGLRELFSRHAPWLAARLRGVLPAAEVEDVLQETFGWTGPMAYWLATESVLAAHWTTAWIWPARPPHDRGAAICAALVFGGLDGQAAARR